MAPERAFELREAKLRPPRTGSRAVPRPTIERRLADTTATPIVIVCAGAGYGKTTTLVRWAATSDRPVAWVSLDGNDNDPVTLLTYVAEAMERQVGIDAAVFHALASPGLSVEAQLIPRLGAALADVTEPLLLILDDVHAVQDPTCVDALVALALHVPAGVQIVFSTRDASALPVGVWRTRELCVEVGPQDLRMDEPEARELLDATGDGYSDDDVAALVRQTEGWPAGLYLAGLSAGAAGVEPAPATLSGNDPLVADFLRSELLAAIPPEQLEFLMYSSVLEPLSGPLCDAALQRTGSARLLEELERTNRFVVALDRERTHYRCHHLVRDLLAEELSRTAPKAIPPLLLRASDWSLSHRGVIEGIGYAQAAGDVERVAGAVVQWAQPVLHSGRVTTVQRLVVGTPRRRPPPGSRGPGRALLRHRGQPGRVRPLDGRHRGAGPQRRPVGRGSVGAAARAALPGRGRRAAARRRPGRRAGLPRPPPLCVGTAHGGAVGGGHRRPGPCG